MNLKINKHLEKRTAPLKYSMADLIDKFNYKDLSPEIKADNLNKLLSTKAGRETLEYNLRTGKNLSKGEYVARRTLNVLDSYTVAELNDMKREAARKEKEKLKSAKNIKPILKTPSLKKIKDTKTNIKNQMIENGNKSRSVTGYQAGAQGTGKKGR